VDSAQVTGLARREVDQARRPRLVPAYVTDAKFNEQLERWQANADTYARRGWLLLSTGDLTVDVGFLQNVAMGGRTIPVMTACVRLDYWNYDLWAPSLTFLDPLTRRPAPPPVRATDRVSATEVRDALIDHHPGTLQPFLCLPGIREYHSHPQHSGDDWLLHRQMREGDLAVVCERIWRRMARNVLGMSVAIQSLASVSGNIANQLDITLLQGDADLVQRQLAEQHAAQEAAAAQARAVPDQPQTAMQDTDDSKAAGSLRQEAPDASLAPASEHGLPRVDEPPAPTDAPPPVRLPSRRKPAGGPDAGT